MSSNPAFNEDMKTAMRAQEKDPLSTISFLLAVIKAT